jgi:hypothetical protein
MFKFWNRMFKKYPLTVGIGTFAFLSFGMMVFIWQLKPAHMIEIMHPNMSQQ